MKRLLSYDRATGIKEIFHYDEVNDKSYIETIQDVEKAVDNAKALANDPEYTRQNMKTGWLHYAHIPDVLILELRVKHGLNVFDKNHTNAVFRKINSDYSHLKVTHMNHSPKG